MKTKLLIIDRGQLGILTDTLKYCEYLHCHFNILNSNRQCNSVEFIVS